MAQGDASALDRLPLPVEQALSSASFPAAFGGASSGSASTLASAPGGISMLLASDGTTAPGIISSGGAPGAPAGGSFGFALQPQLEAAYYQYLPVPDWGDTAADGSGVSAEMGAAVAAAGRLGVGPIQAVVRSPP